METSVRDLFRRYEQSFNAALRGQANLDEAASYYAAEFIAASPAGVAAAKNDDRLRQAMSEGYARYRAIGTKSMRVRDVRISAIDEHHCVAHVAWGSSYAGKDGADIAIDFEVHYLVQKLAEEPRIFGWVSGDEEALLREHGVI